MNYQIPKIIKDELKDSTACIDCDMGGRAKFCFSLILSLLEYDVVAPGNIYIRCKQPATLTIPSGTSQKSHTDIVDIKRRETSKEMKVVEIVYLKNYVRKYLLRA